MTTQTLRISFLAAFLAIVVLIGGCVPKNQVQQPTDQSASVEPLSEEATIQDSSSITVTLAEQNNSGQSGSAMLTEVDGQTRVILEVVNALAGTPQPAHIHLNACATIGGVKYPLNPVVDVRSETVVDVSLEELTSSEQLSINVHKSAAEANLYVACGDLPFSGQNGEVSGAAESTMPTPPQPEDNQAPVSDQEITADEEEIKTITISARNFEFSDQEIRVKQGDRVKLVFSNDDGFHDWTLSGFGVATRQIPAGQTDTIEFTADQSGSFEYYCSVGNHRQLGMSGTLIVE